MQIDFLLTRVKEISDIPLSEYDEKGSLKHIYNSLEDKQKPYSYVVEHIDKIIARLEHDIFSLCFISNTPICMCGCKNDNTYLIWGPIAIRQLNQLEKNKYLQLINSKRREIEDLYYCKFNTLLSEVSLVLSWIRNIEYTPDKLLPMFEEEQILFPSFESEVAEYIINREDALLINHTYVEEQYFFDKIREGDLEAIRKEIQFENNKYPIILNDNLLKNEEYMAVAFITIATRAAINGGATSAECFAISDIYLKRLSQCKTFRDIKKTTEEVAIAFTVLVNKYRTQQSDYGYVEDCKKYIIQNIFKKISLSDIAKNLKLNASYLSKLFSKSENITISDYIRREKINVAKNLLIYSDRTIYEISEYLYYNSQSYFGSIFKKETGMTPQEFREKNHPPNF